MAIRCSRLKIKGVFMKTKVKILFPFSLLIALVLVFPVLIMFFSSFQGTDGGIGISNYTEIFKNNYYRKAIMNSLYISLIAAVIGEILSILGAWAISRLSEKTQNTFLTLFNMAASFAGIPLAFSLIILFGNSGILKAIATASHLSFLGAFNVYSLPGLILAYTFFEVPLGIMFLFPPIKEINSDWKEASQVLGANNWFFLKKIIVPLILPNIIETFIILFANAMGTYETMYALTGNNVVSIPIVIGALTNGSLDANIPLACALSTIFAAIMMLLVALGNRLTRRSR